MAITNTLIARIEEITAAGESYKNSNVYKNRKDEIEKSFLPTYRDMNSKFNSVFNSFLALSTICDISVDFEPIKDAISRLKNKVVHDDYDKMLVNSLKRELDKIDAELMRNWKAYISDRTSSIAGVLETLDKIIADTPEKKILDSKKSIFSNGSIGSTIAITAINDYVTTYNGLMDKLSLKDSVLTFIKLLTSGRVVTLIDMNQDVFDWLKNSGFAGKINLGIGK